MLAAPIPQNEPTRLTTLRSLKLLDTPAEERFDRLTRLARRLFDVPIALVSLIETTSGSSPAPASTCRRPHATFPSAATRSCRTTCSRFPTPVPIRASTTIRS